MAEIKKQTVKGSVYAYLGIVIGFVVTVLLQPKALSEREIGLLRVVTAYATLLLPFCNLGFTNAALRFFPYFRDPKKNHHGFLFLFLAITVIGCAIGMLVLFLFKDVFIKTEDIGLFNEYLFGIIAFSLSLAFFGVFDTYSRLLFDSVSGRFLKEFFTRLAMLTAVLLLLFFNLSFSSFFMLWLLANCLPALLLVLKLYWDGNLDIRPDFSLLQKPLLKEMTVVSLFAILSNSSSVVIQHIDGIMIAKYLNLAENGIFGVTMYFGVVIAMPVRLVYSSATTQVSENWKSNDIANIAKMYRSSCLYLTIIALILFLGIWMNIDSIMMILPPKYAAGKYVILFMGLGAIIDMVTGLNGIVLITSRFYKYDTYFIISLIGLTIGLNYLLIPRFQIVGVAMAYAASMFTINLFRFLFVWWKFNMQPYTLEWLKVLLAGAITYLAVAYWPHINPHILQGVPLEDLAVRSLGVVVVFIPLLLLFSPHINELSKSYLAQAKARFLKK